MKVWIRADNISLEGEFKPKVLFPIGHIGHEFAVTPIAKKIVANSRRALEPNARRLILSIGIQIMPHVVTSKCMGCKFTDCVEVCPVACFYEMDNQLVIHPEDCIDCTACVAECPVEAIYEESDVPAEFQPNTEFNAVEARRLKDSSQEAIVKKKDPLPTAEQRKGELGY